MMTILEELRAKTARRPRVSIPSSEVAMKAGMAMGHEFTFIDQTLKYSLRQGRIDFPELRRLKRQAALMGRAVFDLPLGLLRQTGDQAALELRDVRLEIAPEVDQVRAAAAVGCRQIKLKLGPERAAEAIGAVLTAARESELQVTLHGIDIGNYASAEMDFWKELTGRYSVAHLLIDDFSGGEDPLSTHRTLREWRELFPVELEYCGRNQLGLAVGNALGAVKSGVRRLAVSCGGVGGFPAWEEVGMGINRLLKLPLAIPMNLALQCRGILAEIGVVVGANKPIIGSKIFAHESGIHVDGVYKKSELYEPFAPEDIGLARQIIIGKHSGKAALEVKLKELQVDPDTVNLTYILAKVRQLAVAQKAPVMDEQLQRLVAEAASNENRYY
jgi:homocitrate synthase NifV